MTVAVMQRVSRDRLIIHNDATESNEAMPEERRKLQLVTWPGGLYTKKTQLRSIKDLCDCSTRV